MLISKVERADDSILKWSGQTARISVDKLTKKIYVSDVEGTERRGRPNWRMER